MKIVVNNSLDVDEVRAWLVAHKEATGMSWPELGKLAGVNGNTISTFGSGKYPGDNERIAASVAAYRDRLSVQSELAADMPQLAPWYDTETSTRLTGCSRWRSSAGS